MYENGGNNPLGVCLAKMYTQLHDAQHLVHTQVEHSHDEGVLLKLLQTTLTMFQSSQQITEEQVGNILF